MTEEDPCCKRPRHLRELAGSLIERYKRTGSFSRIDGDVKELLNQIRRPVSGQKGSATDNNAQPDPLLLTTTREAWQKRSSRRHHLTTGQRQEVISAYKDGASLTQLAQKYGVHFSTISRIVHGRQPRGVKRKLTFEQAEEIRRRYRDENLSITALARAYQVSPSAVSHNLQGLQYKN